jgi:hypothetical protein
MRLIVLSAGMLSSIALATSGCCLVPDLDELLATLGVVEGLLELGLHLRGLLLALDDLALVHASVSVAGRDGLPGCSGIWRPVGKSSAAATSALGYPLGEIVDDRGELALVGDGLDCR